MLEMLVVFGAKYLFLVIVIVAVAYAFRQPKDLRVRMLVCAAIALPVAYVAAKIAGALYYDPRPFVAGHFAPLLPHAADNGFPSDHTLLSAAIAAVIFVFNRKLGTVLFVLAFLVGASRVFAGIHHWIDILGSLAIAFLAVWIVYRQIFPRIWNVLGARFPQYFPR